MKDRHMRSTRQCVRGGLAVAIGLVECAVGGAHPVAAAPYENVHESFTFSEDLSDFCGVAGMTVNYHEVVDEHRLIVRRGGNGLYYFHANIHEIQTYTNLATDNALTIDRRINERDATVVFNDDGTVTLTVATTGRAKVYGADGKTLLIDTGLVELRYLLDADLQFLAFLGVVRDTGRSDTEGRDFCEDVLTVIA